MLAIDRISIRSASKKTGCDKTGRLLGYSLLRACVSCFARAVFLFALAGSSPPLAGTRLFVSLGKVWRLACLQVCLMSGICLCC